jgi:hypothetical protein
MAAVFGFTKGLPFITRDTVALDTPASRAISAMFISSMSGEIADILIK